MKKLAKKDFKKELKAAYEVSSENGMICFSRLTHEFEYYTDIIIKANTEAMLEVAGI